MSFDCPFWSRPDEKSIDVNGMIGRAKIERSQDQIRKTCLLESISDPVTTFIRVGAKHCPKCNNVIGYDLTRSSRSIEK